MKYHLLENTVIDIQSYSRDLLEDRRHFIKNDFNGVARLNDIRTDITTMNYNFSIKYLRTNESSIGSVSMIVRNYNFLYEMWAHVVDYNYRRLISRFPLRTYGADSVFVNGDDISEEGIAMVLFSSLIRKGVMKLAFEIAKANKLKTHFNKDKQSDGREWFEGFMNRHSELNLRQPELTSQAMASSSNKVVVYTLFDVLENNIDEHKFTAERILNMDETSHTVVQRSENIVAQKGKHEVEAITCCDRGKNGTRVYTVSATDFYVPPTLIYPRKRMKESVSFGAPPHTIFCCQDKRWMNVKIFCHWIEHFVAVVNPSAETKFLLILAGPRSHTQSLVAIEVA
uniref:DDE-1 domain-containing protein n=1 Tax=Timema shepardi TaxID=629360 RepID=A0A7R9AN18_TIMSH|nr:unnamed protein product [Timema shepardi]